MLSYLGDPERMRVTRERGYLVGRDIIWPAVGQSYLDSFQRASRKWQAMTQAAIVPSRLAGHPHRGPELGSDGPRPQRLNPRV